MARALLRLSSSHCLGNVIGLTNGQRYDGQHQVVVIRLRFSSLRKPPGTLGAEFIERALLILFHFLFL